MAYPTIVDVTNAAAVSQRWNRDMKASFARRMKTACKVTDVARRGAME
jgi:hypothetical protein